MPLRYERAILTKGINCSGITDSDPVWSSEVKFNVKRRQMPFLKKFKNPCWYELQTNQNVGNGGCPVRLRCLPYFMIIGQPKCATTDLYIRLSLHPQIQPGLVKGPHWWTRKRYNGVSFSSYVSMFDKAAEIIRKTAIHPTRGFQRDVITGEASPSTLWDTFGLAAPSYDRKRKLFKQKIAADIKSLTPRVKLIVILRNPVERLYSDYLYFANGTRSPEIFHLLTNNSVMAFNNCTRFFSVSYCLHNNYVRQQLQVRLNLGIYAVYLQEWYEVFPEEQILVINFDDYVSDMKDCLTRIFSFLRLKELSDNDFTKILSQPAHNVNQRVYRQGGMLPQTRALLENFYSRYNVQLARLLRNNNFLWKGPKEAL